MSVIYHNLSLNFLHSFYLIYFSVITKQEKKLFFILTFCLNPQLIFLHSFYLIYFTATTKQEKMLFSILISCLNFLPSYFPSKKAEQGEKRLVPGDLCQYKKKSCIRLSSKFVRWFSRYPSEKILFPFSPYINGLLKKY